MESFKRSHRKVAEMRLDDLTRADIIVLFGKYKALINDRHMQIPSVTEVKEDLLGGTRQSERLSLVSDLPDSKLKLILERDGDIRSVLCPNQIRETEFAEHCKTAYDEFAVQYIASRTNKGLPP